jgi:type IX secretion system PorP/SprF family membrane protein
MFDSKKNLFLLPLFACCFFLSVVNSFGQSRKYFGQFNQLKSYLNPAMGGFEGSSVNSFVRNQWAGFDDAPKTFLLTAELDFAQLKGEENSTLMGKNGISLNLLNDNYGPFKETEIIIAYASRVRISESANLRLGAGVNLNSHELDGFNLTTEQSNDPVILPFQGKFSKMNFLDFNLGIALTHEKYFLSYALNNISQGKISGGDLFITDRAPVSILHAGYRTEINDKLSFSGSFLYRSQNNLPDNTEVNARIFLKQKFWLGAGHRFSYANNFQFGVLFSKLKFGYVYELPLAKSYLLPNPSHEFMLTFFLFNRDRDNHLESAW